MKNNNNERFISAIFSLMTTAIAILSFVMGRMTFRSEALAAGAAYYSVTPSTGATKFHWNTNTVINP